MKLLKEIGEVILAAIIVALLLALMAFLAIAFGYFIGMFIAVLPFVSGWLTDTLPITKAQIPGITAWLAVVGLFIGRGAKVSTNVSTKAGK